jgi:hypothetical protein
MYAMPSSVVRWGGPWLYRGACTGNPSDAAAAQSRSSVVGVGEMAFGLFAGTAKAATWPDVAQNFGLAVDGNLAGGLGFVTLMRVLQVRGEPGVRPASVTTGEGSVRETEAR